MDNHNLCIKHLFVTTFIKEEQTMYRKSNHMEVRANQRGLSLDAVDYILDHAKGIHQGGVIFYYLRKRDIPDFDQKYQQIYNLAGTALVVSKDRSTIITIWKNKTRGLKHIRTKADFTFSLAQM